MHIGFIKWVYHDTDSDTVYLYTLSGKKYPLHCVRGIDDILYEIPASEAHDMLIGDYGLTRALWVVYSVVGAEDQYKVGLFPDVYARHRLNTVIHGLYADRKLADEHLEKLLAEARKEAV